MNTIIEKIQRDGAIPFAEFMHLALYAPGDGYYASGHKRISAEGDFITAPTLSPYFGHSVAKQCQAILAHYPNGVILEFGAGNGALCAQILDWLDKHNSLPERYYILEVSPSLRAEQQERIANLPAKQRLCVEWLDSLPTQAIQGVILGNEVFDAMPVHRFLHQDGNVLESMVNYEDNRFVERFVPTQNPALEHYVKTHIPLTLSPYQSEVNLTLPAFMQSLSSILEAGSALWFDYGFPRHEYYHPDRRTGTLMCHLKHRSHSNPFFEVGQQDITAHVDFTHVAESAYDAGFRIAGYANQASFLLSLGILELLQQEEDLVAGYNASQQVKKLLDPQEMGELFKVIALQKGSAHALQGFQFFDKRASLS